MKPDPVIERLDFLTKREAKLTRDVAAASKHISNLRKRVRVLAEALQKGLPHMNLGEDFNG